jgi:hypothetical protein
MNCLFPMKNYLVLTSQTLHMELFMYFLFLWLPRKWHTVQCSDDPQGLTHLSIFQNEELCTIPWPTCLVFLIYPDLKIILQTYFPTGLVLIFIFLFHQTRLSYKLPQVHWEIKDKISKPISPWPWPCSSLVKKGLTTVFCLRWTCTEVVDKFLRTGCCQKQWSPSLETPFSSITDVLFLHTRTCGLKSKFNYTKTFTEATAF